MREEGLGLLVGLLLQCSGVDGGSQIVKEVVDEQFVHAKVHWHIEEKIILYLKGTLLLLIKYTVILLVVA